MACSSSWNESAERACARCGTAVVWVSRGPWKLTGGYYEVSVDGGLVRRHVCLPEHEDARPRDFVPAVLARRAQDAAKEPAKEAPEPRPRGGVDLDFGEGDR